MIGPSVSCSAGPAGKRGSNVIDFEINTLCLKIGSDSGGFVLDERKSVIFNAPRLQALNRLGYFDSVD